MEVHHHTHHPKKWTEYFWEFFMLFLAVFCGYLAEYQLEHKIERDRVKKYMHDMVENLKYDIERINRNTPRNKEVKIDCDSLRNEIKKAIDGQINHSKLYYYYYKKPGSGLVTFNRAAITQLKNSGQLRLVKNDSLLKKILDYYERLIYATDVFRDLEGKELENLVQISNEIFSTTSLKFLDTISDTISPFGAIDFKNDLPKILNNKELKLLSSDKITLEKFHNSLLSFELALVNYNRFLYYSRTSAKDLIIQINKEYHFED
ncbi:MAG: hypothetical protein IKD55_08875 [Sediminibacterium sp.]|nr:hypothetical protein [Sediminibacterium sp.]MBX9778804.1 hypothetical protein [Chitinophagaceae bacterium]